MIDYYWVSMVMTLDWVIKAFLVRERFIVLKISEGSYNFGIPYSKRFRGMRATKRSRGVERNKGSQRGEHSVMVHPSNLYLRFV